MEKYVEQLSSQHHCISIKLPGHGGTPTIDDSPQPSIATEIALIREIITTLSDQPVHVVGHSYGGVVPPALAPENTVNISKLSLFEPVAERQTHACGQVIDFWGGENSYATLPDFIKDTMAAMTAENIRHAVILQCTRPKPSDYALSAYLRDQSNPILRNIAQLTTGAMPNSQQYSIQGASLFLVTSHSDACIAILSASA